MRPFTLLLLNAVLIAPLSAFDPSDQDDSMAVVRQFVKPSNPVGPPIEQGSFSALPGETISLMGGTMVFQMEDHGHFEAAMQSSFPDKQIRVRNLGWPADTVYRQERPMYFYTEKGDQREGSLPDQRHKIDPGTLFLFFGRTESLDAIGALDEFERAYEALVMELLGFSRRLVLVGPIDFAPEGPAASLASERNVVLAAYEDRIEKIAGRRGVIYVKIGSLPSGSFAANGMDLLSTGHEILASRISDALGLKPVPQNPDLLSVIRSKDHLWDQYHRPTNWAFLFGDRQYVPSSRDHLDANKRWFIEEIGKIPQLIEMADESIWNSVNGK